MSVATCAVSVHGVPLASLRLLVSPESICEDAHVPVRLEVARPLDQQGAGQPEERGERGAVLEARAGLDRHRDPEMTAARDAPVPAQRPAELSLYESALGFGGQETVSHCGIERSGYGCRCSQGALWTLGYA